jgi:hypothetical protein
MFMSLLFILRPEVKIITYEEFCYGVAVIWSILKKYWIKLKNLRGENKQKVNYYNLCLHLHLLKLFSLIVPTTQC